MKLLDAETRFDPTGTGGIRSRFRGDSDRRWARMRVMVVQAIMTHDLLAMGPPTLETVGRSVDRVGGFEKWLTATYFSVVMSDPEWIRSPVREAIRLAHDRAEKKWGAESISPHDRSSHLQTLAVSEMRGIAQDLVRRATRLVAHALLNRARVSEMARLVASEIIVASKRARMAANHCVALAYNKATLDALRARGFRKVGVRAEFRRGSSAAERGPVKSVVDGSIPSPVSTDDGWSEAAREAALEARRAHAAAKEAAKAFIQGPGKKIIEKVSENKHELLAAAVTFSLYHLLGADYPMDVDEALHHEVAHFASNAKVSVSQARGMMSKAVDGLISLRGTGLGTHDAEDKILEALLQLKSFLDRTATFDAVGWTPSLASAKASMIFAPIKTKKKAPGRRAQARIEEHEEELQRLTSVEVLTAGDDKVCDECQDISDEGPYDIDTAEGLIPAHTECRCVFVPADDNRYANVRE